MKIPYYARFMWKPVFEDDAAAKAKADADAKAKADADSKANADKKFSQEDLNKMLAEDRRKHQTQVQKALEELEAIKAKAQLTDSEKSELETRMEDMRKQLLTKEELAKQELDKSQKKAKVELDTLTKERDSWKLRYTDSTIIGAIVDASAKHEAFDPEQIVAILRTDTRLAEDLDSDGKPTGKLVPKVTFKDKDKDGKAVTIEIAVEEAVKKMTEIDKYSNLFKDSGSGGLGRGNRDKTSGSADIAELARTNPAKYRELRKAGKIKF